MSVHQLKTRILFAASVAVLVQVGLVMGLAGPARAASTYTPNTDFIAPTGTSAQGWHQWSYQYATPGSYAYTNMSTYDSVNTRWNGPDAGSYVGIESGNGTWLWPAAHDVALTWTAPGPGTVAVAGYARMGAGGGDGVNVSLLKNATSSCASPNWCGSVAAGDLVGTSFLVQNVSVATGDQLHFRVNQISNMTGDKTFFIPRLQFKPSGYVSPTSVGLQLDTQYQDPATVVGAWRGSPLTAESYYERFSSKPYAFVTGDCIEYNVSNANPGPGLGGLEIETTSGGNFRTSGWVDQNGVSGSPTSDISPYAYRKTYHRILQVTPAMVGSTAAYWDLGVDNSSALYSAGGAGGPSFSQSTYSNIEVTNCSGTPRAGGVVFATSSDWSSVSIYSSVGATGYLSLVNAAPPSGTSATVQNGTMSFPPSDRWVIATVDATQSPYLATRYTGTGTDLTTDDTASIQRAIDDVYDAGGGTVYLPAGRYNVGGDLTVPNGVVLQGDWKNPDTWAASESGAIGTILEASENAGNANGTPFITLTGSFSGGSLDGLSIWYPQQGVPQLSPSSSPTPYPWTIAQSGGAAPVSIQNVTLINSYQGIDSGSLAYVRNVYGSPIMTGLRVMRSYDTSTIRNLNWSYNYWYRSGLPGSPSNAMLNQQLQWNLANPTVGVQLGDSDDQMIYGATIDGYSTGLALTTGSRPSTSATWGQLAGIHVEDSNTAMSIAATNSSIGVSVTNSILHANKIGVQIAAAYDGTTDRPITITNSTIGTTDAANNKPVYIAGNAEVSLLDDVFDNWSSAQSGYAIWAASGTVSIEGSSFQKNPLGSGGRHVFLDTGVKSATVIANTFASGTPLIDSLQGTVPGRIVIDTTTTSYAVPANPGVSQPAATLSNYRPSSSAIYNVLNSVSGCSTCTIAAANGATDDTAAIQGRLTYAAAHGGGTVYLPAGHYLLAGTLTVGSGVELRGSTDAVQYSDAEGSYLLSTVTGSTPTITLSGGAVGAGVRGIKMDWPLQGERSTALTSYPWAISAIGTNTYVIDTLLVNAYKGVQFGSGSSANNHLVRGLFGLALNTALSVGPSSQGWIEDAHWIRTAWSYSQLGSHIPESQWGDPSALPACPCLSGYPPANNLHTYSLATTVGLTLSGTTAEHVLDEFNFEVFDGVVANSSSGSGPAADLINVGSDQAYDANFNISSSSGSGLRVLNALGTGFSAPGNNFISATGGTSAFFGVSFWVTVDHSKGISVNGAAASVTVAGGTLATGSASVAAGSMNLSGLYFQGGGTQVSAAAGTVVGSHVDGNVGLSGFAFADASGGNATFRSNIQRVP